MSVASMIDLSRLDPRLAQGARRIAEAVSRLPVDPRYGVQPLALLVGGCVRDALITLTSTDIDLEVFGVAPDRLEALLQDLYPGVVNPVGRSFGILKIHLAEDAEIDVALPRHESKAAPGHRGFEIKSDPGMDLAEAARRRDFTINAIYADPLTGEIFDPFDGRADLATKELRVVDPATFGDDPLRVYRAVQFAARFGLRLSPATRQQLQQMVERGDLDELPAERITDELRKLFLKTEKPSIGFTLLRELGIVERDLPELQALIGTVQEPEWHPEGDVWIHTLMVIDVAASIIRQETRNFTQDAQLQVMAGALCHDLGKPSTTQREDGRIRSKGHEDAGKEPTERLMAHWTFGERVDRAAVAVAMNHLKPGMLFRALEKGELTEQSYTNAIRKLLKRIYPVSWRVLIAASEADFRGRGLPHVASEPYLAGQHLAQVIMENGLDTAPPEPLLHGRDLVALGVPPGPRIGMIISQIEDARDAGTISTHAEALAEATRLIGL